MEFLQNFIYSCGNGSSNSASSAYSHNISEHHEHYQQQQHQQHQQQQSNIFSFPTNEDRLNLYRKQNLNNGSTGQALINNFHNLNEIYPLYLKLRK
jgi:hypothetical protein